MTLNIGITRERENGYPSLTPFTPTQCKTIESNHDIKFTIQPSNDRCFSNDEYKDLGIKLDDNLNNCPYIFGIRDIELNNVLKDKTYFLNSNIQKQASSQKSFLQSQVVHNNSLIEYDLILDQQKKKLAATGKYQGIVGAHNVILAIGQKSKSFQLPRIISLDNLEDLAKTYEHVKLPALKIAILGIGPIQSGVIEVMKALKIKEISPELFVLREFPDSVYTQLNEFYIAKRQDGESFTMNHFYENAETFESDFGHFMNTTDVLINCIEGDIKIPSLFDLKSIQSEEFRLKYIADLSKTRDYESPIPCASTKCTYDNPVAYYDKETLDFCAADGENVLSIICSECHSNEFAKEASEDIGTQLLDNVIPSFFSEKRLAIDNATIVKDGKLTEKYSYLEAYMG